MITVKDIKNAPAILNEKDRNFSFQKLDALKGLHVSLSGYSIGEGEEVLIPSAEQIEENPTAFLKIGVTRKGSTNKSALLRVNRKNPGSDTWYEGWLNLSVLSRVARDAEGKVVQIDAFREEMNMLNDDQDRVAAILGKKLVGTGKISAYTTKFVDNKPALDENGNHIYKPAEYITIECVDGENTTSSTKSSTNRKR